MMRPVGVHDSDADVHLINFHHFHFPHFPPTPFPPISQWKRYDNADQIRQTDTHRGIWIFLLRFSPARFFPTPIAIKASRPTSERTRNDHFGSGLPCVIQTLLPQTCRAHNICNENKHINKKPLYKWDVERLWLLTHRDSDGRIIDRSVSAGSVCVSLWCRSYCCCFFYCA